jgi:uncharacterized protein (TIRG00374 family)
VGVGPWLALAFLPNLIALTLDTLAWRALLTWSGPRMAFLDLLRVRLRAESIGLFLPSGGLVQEVVALRTLHRRYRVPIAESLASLLARRFLLIEAHGIMVALAALLLLLSIGLRPAGPLLPWLLAVVALVLWAIGRFGPRVFTTSGHAALRSLRRLPCRRLGLWTERHRQELHCSQRALARLALRSHRERSMSLATFLLVLLAEVLETFTMLRLLGSSMGFAQVLAFDPVVSLARALCAVVPAGLGVQEAGYAAFLLAANEPDAAGVAAAFVVLKRLKDVFFGVVGILVLLGFRSTAGWTSDDAERAGALRLRLAQPDHPDARDRAGAA